MIRPLACFAVAALFLCSAPRPDGLAQAQVFVSNTGQPIFDGGVPFFFDQAQAFTTGSHSDGYTLASVDIYFSEAYPNPAYSVSIWTSGLGGRPSIRVGSLSLPATLVVDANAFTTSGIDLDAETTYLVVVDVESDPNFHTIRYTPSDNEDAGRMPGWSIGNSFYREMDKTPGGWEIGQNIIQIQINGPIPPAPTTPTTPSTPGGISDAPQYLRATAGDSEVTLTWDTPFYNSGSEITGYAYRYKENGEIFGAWTDIPESGTGEANETGYTVTGLTNGLEYTFEVRTENQNGGGIPARAIVRLPASADSQPVSTESEELPDEAALMGNYPNPFNPETAISYALPQAGEVRLAVYDLLGHELAVLVDGLQSAGRHTVRFDANDLPSGPYAYRLQAGAKVLTRTMMLVK